MPRRDFRTAVADVADDADDSPLDLAGAGLDQDPLADRILARPVLPRRGLVDQHDLRAAG